MPFASFNPTNPRTSPLNFHKKKNQELAILKNDLFFESAILIFFFFIFMKTSQSLLISKDWLKFWWLLWFPAKNHSPQTFQPAVYQMGELVFLNMMWTKIAQSLLSFLAQKQQQIVCNFCSHQKSIYHLLTQITFKKTF